MNCHSYDLGKRTNYIMIFWAVVEILQALQQKKEHSSRQRTRAEGKKSMGCTAPSSKQ